MASEYTNKKLDKWIKILQAYKENKRIQVKLSESTDKWVTISPSNYVFNFADYNYRIAKTPIEFWINLYDDTAFEKYIIHSSKENALDSCNTKIAIRCGIHMKEVIENE